MVIGFGEIFAKQPTYLGVLAVIIGALAIYGHVFGVDWAYLPLAAQYVSCCTRTGQGAAIPKQDSERSRDMKAKKSMKLHYVPQLPKLCLLCFLALYPFDERRF